MLQYMCPNCNGQLTYRSDKEALVCDSCQSAVNPASLRQPRSFPTCVSCGSQLEVADNIYSAFCDACQASFINDKAFLKGANPDYIAPFEIDEKDAERKFNEWLSTRRWVPNQVRKEVHITARNRYLMPFYIYGFHNEGKQTWDCVKTRKVGSGKNSSTVKDHYDVVVEGKAIFSEYPVDAMIELKDEIVDFIAPFDNEKCTEFLKPLFSGVNAKKQDYTVDEMQPRAVEAIKRYTADYMSSRIVGGYSSKTLKQDNMNYELMGTALVYYPVYMLTITYNDKEYSFYMNGQTGKVCGEIPISKVKVVLACVAYWAVVIFIIFVIIALTIF